ncbi:MAG: thioredoxin fold domain-containing protein [Candidatus Thiodiazotropha sp.]
MNPTRILLLLLISMLLAPPISAAGRDLLPPAADLRLLGGTAENRGIPILLMVSQSRCSYCERMKDEVLNPMLLGGDYDRRVLMRELSVDTSETIINFAGRHVAAGEFRDRYEVHVTPTLLFLDGNGDEVAQRILGINTVDYLLFYIENAIETATRAMAR